MCQKERNYTQENSTLTSGNKKTKNPREFWKVIKTETNSKQSQFNATLFVEFVDHFCELNSDPLFSGTVSPLYNPVITGENEHINRPFSLEEVKLAIRKLKNNKASGVDNIKNFQTLS